MTVAVIDIDTTVADCDHRAECLKRDSNGKITQASWDTFLDPALMELDTLVPHARECIDMMRRKGYRIVFLTGRNVLLEDVTKTWLREHLRFNSWTEDLIMRPVEERNVPASVYKERVFREKVLEVHGKVPYLFFEDDPYVLRVWKKYGLVFKCPEAWEYMNPKTLSKDEPAWKR